MEPKKFSSENIENEVLTLTSKTLSYKYLFDTKLKEKFYQSDKFF